MVREEGDQVSVVEAARRLGAIVEPCGNCHKLFVLGVPLYYVMRLNEDGEICDLPAGIRDLHCSMECANVHVLTLMAPLRERIRDGEYTDRYFVHVDEEGL